MTARDVDRRSEPARTEGRNTSSSELARTEGRNLSHYIRSIPDFPKPGIVFRDITPLLASPVGLDASLTALTGLTQQLRPDVVIGAEARGFLFGPALACRLGAGFVLARKPGSLPHRTIRAEYALEYGTSVLELHEDAIEAGARVLVHDDLLATGGTAAALCELVEQLGGVVVGCAFLIELAFLPGRAALAGRDVHTLISYAEE
ncbi:MAG: adenine phosphoribosyltransferase [Solirubrobacteraceae bacterium]|nr:adenine phosphoribosyltransferase [Solirubrobacteraceae bacterium]